MLGGKILEKQTLPTDPGKTDPPTRPTDPGKTDPQTRPTDPVSPHTPKNLFLKGSNPTPSRPGKHQILIRPPLIRPHSAVAGVAAALHLARDGRPAVVEFPVAGRVLLLQLGAEGDQLVEERCLHGNKGRLRVHGALQHGEDSFGVLLALLIRPPLICLHIPMTGVASALHLTCDGSPAIVEPSVQTIRSEISRDVCLPPSQQSPIWQSPLNFWIWCLRVGQRTDLFPLLKLQRIPFVCKL